MCLYQPTRPQDGAGGRMLSECQGLNRIINPRQKQVSSITRFGGTCIEKKSKNNSLGRARGRSHKNNSKPGLRVRTFKINATSMCKMAILHDRPRNDSE